MTSHAHVELSSLALFVQHPCATSKEMILRHSSRALLLAVYAYTVLFAWTRASGELTEESSVGRSIIIAVSC